MKYINHNNAEAIKRLAERLEYEVLNVKKEARISPIYNDSAFNDYMEDMKQLYEECRADIVAIHNANTLDYSNIFTTRNRQIENAIDINRVKLTRKERGYIDEIISCDYKGNLDICWNTDLEAKEVERIEKKILSSLTIDTVNANGYSQSDWDKYAIVYYNDTKHKKTIDFIKKNLGYLFTVQGYSIELVDIETRKYSETITETEEVETDVYYTVSYSGDLDEEEKELRARGHEIIHKD